MIIASKNGLFLRFNRNETEWVEREEDATVFATEAAFRQCLSIGRLWHLRLTFVGWVYPSESRA